MNSTERAGLRPKGNVPNIGKVPNLRFPEFSGEWLATTIDGVTSEFQSGKFIKADLIQSKGSVPVYGGNGLRGYTDTYNHIGDYVLIGRQGALCGNVRFVTGETYITEHAIAVKGTEDNDTKYLQYLLERMNLGQYSDQSAQPGLAVSKLIKLKITIPPKREQSKIARLLTVIDERITTQIRIIKDLKSLSDAICERLYTPSEKGSWQTYKYADLFSISNERNSKLQYTNVLSASQEYGMIERNELNIDIKFEASSITNYKIVRPNQYVIHLRSFQGGFAYSEKTGVCSPAYTILVPTEKLSTAFLKYYFTSKRFIDSLRIVTYGIRDGRSISVDEFLQLKVTIPAIAHQQHIVQVMQLWQEKIRTEEDYLSKLQQQKKFLLSSMFI